MNQLFTLMTALRVAAAIYRADASARCSRWLKEASARMSSRNPAPKPITK